MRTYLALMLTLVISFPAAFAAAADARTVASADLRWADIDATDTPEFRRHVVPLFSKLGCNMRSCHGSFQGQNGFRLSLFGFEPDLDRNELLEPDERSEGDGPRANLKAPDESLVLHKLATPKHEPILAALRESTKDRNYGVSSLAKEMLKRLHVDPEKTK